MLAAQQKVTAALALPFAAAHPHARPLPLFLLPSFFHSDQQQRDGGGEASSGLPNQISSNNNNGNNIHSHNHADEEVGGGAAGGDVETISLLTGEPSHLPSKPQSSYSDRPSQKQQSPPPTPATPDWRGWHLRRLSLLRQSAGGRLSLRVGRWQWRKVHPRLVFASAGSGRQRGGGICRHAPERTHAGRAPAHVCHFGRLAGHQQGVHVACHWPTG